MKLFLLQCGMWFRHNGRKLQFVRPFAHKAVCHDELGCEYLLDLGEVVEVEK